MVIISYYLKSVCLRDSLSLVRPDTGLAAGPAYSLASCYCFCRSLSMNSPFRLRPGSRPGFRLAPATRPPGRSGLHPPLFRSGVQKYTFFPNRQTFREKFFEKFQKTASRPSFTSVLHPYKRNASQYAITKQKQLIHKYLPSYRIKANSMIGIKTHCIVGIDPYHT